MIKLIAKMSLVTFLKISTAWSIKWPSSTCGQLPQYNSPQLTHSTISHNWPWHAAIFYRLSDLDQEYKCGGTLINQNWILTAAHCLFNNGASVVPNKISVSLGKLNLTANESRSEQSFDAAEIIVHEKYSPSYLDNDIALVRLSYTATFNHFVQPICLWRSNETDLSHVVDNYGTVVGWGKTEKYQLSEVLQEARFKVVTHGRCLESNRDFYTAYLTDRNYCAGLRNGTSVCEGDSGGSMTFEKDDTYYIRGIVSSSPSKTNLTTQQLDCDAMEYAIYTDVAMYLQWIDDNMKVDCPMTVKCSNDTYWQLKECNVKTVKIVQRICEIIFDATPDATITSLTIRGEMESIADLSDAISKFKNLEILRLNFTKLKVVERERLTAFKGIKRLDLSDNRITQLKSDTFDDLTELRHLSLAFNLLKTLHAETFKELRNMEVVDLVANHLETLPQSIFSDNRKLKEIYLGANRLSKFHTDIFKELDNLEILFLYGNKLVDLPQDLFRSNKKLRVIDLSNNELTELHVDIFEELESLNEIDLSDNQLEFLPQDLFHKNPKLQKVKLIKNNLKELPTDIFKELYNLTELILRSNKLETLPAGIFRNNQNLQEIDLINNLLTELPIDIFKGLNNLTELYLSENKLEFLPQSVFSNDPNFHNKLTLYQLKKLHVDTFKDLSNLKIIYLSSNKLEHLPQGVFRGNKNLEYIDLQRSFLSTLHNDNFKAVENLMDIDLSSNKLETLPAGIFRNNQNLQKIDLSQNLLTELPIDIFKALYNLTELNLHRNSLKTLPQSIFRNNQNLQEIDLSQNLLTELHNDTFAGMYMLSMLMLAHNELEFLPEGLFRDCRNLVHINLKNNHIDTVECDFFHLSKLEKLIISGNVCINKDFTTKLALNEVDKVIRTQCSG